MHLVLSPGALTTRGQRYVATDASDRVWATSRQPFYAAARALLEAGHSPDEVLTASHAGSSIVAMRSTIGEAAKWTVEEDANGRMRRRPWQARPEGGATLPEGVTVAGGVLKNA